MLNVLMVGLGGFLGAILRYAMGGALGRLKGGWMFPLETLLINLLGCVAIGILAGLSESRGLFSDATRVFLFLGLLGGFTTFSAYGYESFQLMRDGRWADAAISTGLQVALGIGGVWAGHAVAVMSRS